MINKDAQREAFEKRFGPKYSFSWRYENGDYRVASLQSAWEVWQACAEYMQENQRQLEVDLSNLMQERSDLLAQIEVARQPAPDRQVIEGEFAIQVEKLLCKALGREWSATGISIESLIAALAAAKEG